MTDRSSPASKVIATSLAVIACCVLAVTVKVFAGSPVEVNQPRVLEQRALEQRVVDAIPHTVSRPATRDDVTCPASVPVEVGRTFVCEAEVDDFYMIATVEIESELGDLSVLTN